MSRSRKPTVATFRSDPLFPRIERAVGATLKTGRVVTPIDVLVGMHLLTPEKVLDWRRGRVPYLEWEINCNLTRLSRLLRILRFYVHDLKLVPSTSDYRRWGKGRKQRLRFTKTGDARLEMAYATHFVWPGKSPFHPPARTDRLTDHMSAGSRAQTGRESSIVAKSSPLSSGGNVEVLIFAP